MIPPEIISASRLKGLDGIGITDHNSAGNVQAVVEAGDELVTVFGGMEITTQEEIHLLVYFGESVQLADFQEEIGEYLPGKNDPSFFGEQFLVDSEGYVVETSEAFLSGAVDLPIERLVTMAHDRSGLAVAAHIDRESFSIVSQLGFIPDSLSLDGVEVTSNGVNVGGLAGFGDEENLPRVASSDAHTPEQIGSRFSVVRCENLSFEEIRAAFSGEGGRSISPMWA